LREPGPLPGRDPGEEVTVNDNGEPDDRSELDFTIADE
jgi:hypothetical protein